ncbi:hypothetical protein [Dehalobacter sp. TBBPA1]|uniref:hypothetical protein n=1 Tax=Dehalobacter sp. TBBPA1 TaxID=3235037 RepID=UPI0034A40CE0
MNLVINYVSHFGLANEFTTLLEKGKHGRILFVGALPYAINHAKVKLPEFKPQKAETYQYINVINDATVARVLLT